MNINSVYNSPLGRAGVILLQKAGLFRLASRFLRTGLSKKLIPRYIAKHKIDMSDFQGQEYRSFADFFARARDRSHFVLNSDVLISPCCGLLSIYPIRDDLTIPMKGSQYRLEDLVPEQGVAGQFTNGICLVFRLQASDYHHFCAFDDAFIIKTLYLPGELHSVQPIACEKVPVFRLNRRWWSLLDTAHFGPAVQVEVGAMLVGGVHFAAESGWLSRGAEMGHFELAGSTILLLLSSKAGDRLSLEDKFTPALRGGAEIRVSMGEGIGVLTDAKQKRLG